ncbi:hypothetical protein NOC27_800 [Nitrosococcus oceani AFC27]|nr:hypothetical protein NOC27_800 [Nitrosococcus oceani AFC27]
MAAPPKRVVLDRTPKGNAVAEWSEGAIFRVGAGNESKAALSSIVKAIEKCDQGAL